MVVPTWASRVDKREVRCYSLGLRTLAIKSSFIKIIFKTLIIILCKKYLCPSKRAPSQTSFLASTTCQRARGLRAALSVSASIWLSPSSLCSPSRSYTVSASPCATASSLEARTLTSKRWALARKLSTRAVWCLRSMHSYAWPPQLSGASSSGRSYCHKLCFL